MMYIVETGEYSDRQTIAVCYDKKIAESYAKIHHGYVDEVPLIDDENFITLADNMIMQHVFVYFYSKTKCERVRKYSEYIEPDNEYYQKRSGNVFIRVLTLVNEIAIHVYVDDEKRAEKIAIDAFFKLIAEMVEL